MSKILCVIDGMNDLAFDINKYPALASFPERKQIKTVPDGFEVETLPCIFSLLGINPPPKNIRGWIEAVGAGITVGPDDLIFRGSWVELDHDGICIGFCDAPDNIPALDKARIFSLGGYKSLLILPGCAPYFGSIRTHLPFELLGKNIREYIFPDIPILKNTVALLGGVRPNRIMIPWAASIAQDMPDFLQTTAVVSGTNVIKGIAKALNMRLATSDAMTGDTDTDLSGKLHITLELAEDIPFVILHIGGCDEAAHRKDWAEKEAFLSKIDKIVLPGLICSKHIIEVASDHGSDPLTGKHTGGMQPLFLNNSKL